MPDDKNLGPSNQSARAMTLDEAIEARLALGKRPVLTTAGLQQIIRLGHAMRNPRSTMRVLAGIGIDSYGYHNRPYRSECQNGVCRQVKIPELEPISLDCIASQTRYRFTVGRFRPEVWCDPIISGHDLVLLEALFDPRLNFPSYRMLDTIPTTIAPDQR